MSPKSPPSSTSSRNPSPPSRPISVAETFTTTTSLAAHSDTFSDISTPRAGTPNFDDGNLPAFHEPPPTYAESQAHHSSSDGASTVVDAAHDRQLAEMALRLAHPSATALLDQAVSFTRNVVPPARIDMHASPLNRPIAIPALISQPHRFPRLYSRVMISMDITAAIHARFLAGLDAVCTTIPPSETGANREQRERIITEYLRICNERLFFPRGIKASMATLKQVLELSKVPDRGGFRTSLSMDVREAIMPSVPCETDDAVDNERWNAELKDCATSAAAKLEPYIEPLIEMLPSQSPEVDELMRVANGILSLELDGGPLLTRSDTQLPGPKAFIGDEKAPLSPSPPPTLRRGSTSSSTTSNVIYTPPETPTQRRPLDTFWKPIAGAPISVGPIIPPALPRLSLKRGATWTQWGEDFGKRWEKWGNDYGRRWEKWGAEYGQAWNQWSEEAQAKWGSPEHCPYGEGGSPSERWDRMCRDSKERVDEKGDHDDDDSMSEMSDSSVESDSDLEDPEDVFAEKSAKLEAEKQRALAAEPSSDKASKILQKHGDAMRKAEQSRDKKAQRLVERARKRAVKRLGRQFKRDVREWKKRLKRETKGVRSGADAQRVVGERKAEFRDMTERFHRERSEILGRPYEAGEVVREGRRRRESRRERRRGRKGKQPSNASLECIAERQIGYCRKHSKSIVGEDAMMWIVFTNCF